jgi:hypothetical protein
MARKALAQTMPAPTSAAQENPCDRGLELKIEIATLTAEYDELKPAIEAWCEANGGSYNSPLGSYATRYTPQYEYPASVELLRVQLKQAEQSAKASGAAVVVNTAVSVAATVCKNSTSKVRVIS